jgi:hypothetical protein
MVLAVAFMLAATPAFAATDNAVIGDGNNTLAETFTDESGNIVELEYGTDGTDSYAFVYVNVMRNAKPKFCSKNMPSGFVCLPVCVGG